MAQSNSLDDLLWIGDNPKSCCNEWLLLFDPAVLSELRSTLPLKSSGFGHWLNYILLSFHLQGSVKCFYFLKHTIRFFVSSFWQRPGTSAPSTPHLVMNMFLCSTGNARGKARALEGRCVRSKSQGVKTETRELLERTDEKNVSPTRGHWFALQANQWFFRKEKQKKMS